MSKYDQAFEPNILIGQCDLISRFSDFALYPDTQLVHDHLFHTLFGYDKTFDPKVIIGHYDLISGFSDFPLYLGTQVVYEHTSFMICLHMTRPLTVKYSWATVTLFPSSVTLPYILTLSWYLFILLSDYE